MPRSGVCSAALVSAGTYLCVTKWGHVCVWGARARVPAVSEFSTEITLKERLYAQLWYCMPSCSRLRDCMAGTSLRPLATFARLNPRVAMWWAVFAAYKGPFLLRLPFLHVENFTPCEYRTFPKKSWESLCLKLFVNLLNYISLQRRHSITSPVQLEW